MDRDLVEPGLAITQRLTKLTSGLAETRNRQRWQGAIRSTTLEGGGSALSNNTEVTLSSLDLEPGRWFVVARAGVQISSTPGTPTFTGSEIFAVDLRAVSPETQALIIELDSETWSPATTESAHAGGFYAASVILFGAATFEEAVQLQVVGSADEPAVADHLVPWRAGKINALPF